MDDACSGRGTSAQIDEWTGQFFARGTTPTQFNPWASGWFGVDYPALQGPAPVVNLPHSEVSVVQDGTTNDGGRLLRLQIIPAEGVQDLYVQMEGDGGIRIVGLNDEAMAGKTAPSVRLNVNGHPQDPLTVDVRAEPRAPLRVTVQDRRLGLPEGAMAIRPRPNATVAAPFTDVSDSTIVAHTVTIE